MPIAHGSTSARNLTIRNGSVCVSWRKNLRSPARGLESNSWRCRRQFGYISAWTASLLVALQQPPFGTRCPYGGAVHIIKGGSSSGVDAFGCLRSLRARSALDGVSWVQGGSVEIAVGQGPCYTIHAVVC